MKIKSALRQYRHFWFAWVSLMVAYFTPIFGNIVGGTDWKFAKAIQFTDPGEVLTLLVITAALYGVARLASHIRWGVNAFTAVVGPAIISGMLMIGVMAGMNFVLDPKKFDPGLFTDLGVVVSVGLSGFLMGLIASSVGVLLSDARDMPAILAGSGGAGLSGRTAAGSADDGRPDHAIRLEVTSA